ncbi:MAG: hypothetical protein M1819_000790 [Sarea resinae]|nr:MAG: hypothetical protein M1819_000790 [Sarea resinae]
MTEFSSLRGHEPQFPGARRKSLNFTTRDVSRQSDLYPSSPSWKALVDERPAVLQGPSHASAGFQFDPETQRATLQQEEELWAQANPPSKFGYTVEDFLVTMRDGDKILVKVYRPARPPVANRNGESEHKGDSPGPTKTLPLLFVTHGGGWIQGSAVTEEINMLRALIKELDFIIVAPEFRLAPEYPFPTPLDDCWDTLCWAVGNSAFGIEPTNVYLAGSSAGANLAAALALMAGYSKATDHLAIRRRPAPWVLAGSELNLEVKVTGVILNVPVLCHPDFFPTYEFPYVSFTQADNTLLTNAEMRALWNLYLPSESAFEGSNPLASPLLAFLHNFPPCRIYVAGQDCLRDEGIAFAKKLKKFGRDVKLWVYPGVPHTFAEFDDLKETRDFCTDLVTGMKELMAEKPRG